jgi:creatinine amidohydrolase/Fe(II)-dependent formamide hydrolase-like protein
MRSRFLMELTTPEVESYLSRGGNIALLPVGCTEMHGPHQPVGCDTLMAKAFALRLAEKLDGLVLPEINYSWTGATDNFVGTMSIAPELSQAVVEAVAVKAIKSGFTRFALVSMHGPHQYVMAQVVRRVFEKYLTPILFIDPGQFPNEALKEVFPPGTEGGHEASIVLAAMEILGINVYKEKDMCYADEAPPQLPSFRGVRPAMVGYFYQDQRQHACPSTTVSIERGRKFYALQVEQVAKIFGPFAQYIEDVKKTTNKGSWANE